MLNLILGYLGIGMVVYVIACALIVIFSRQIYGIGRKELLKYEAQRFNFVSVLGILLFCAAYPYYIVVYAILVYHKTKAIMANNKFE